MTLSHRIEVAQEHGLQNVDAMVKAAELAEIPFAVACALMEKESGGRNVYGHDAGGALSGFPETVNRENYKVFRWLVFDKSQTSNGVGPAQITSRSLLADMERKHLRPWVPVDNMYYGFNLLKSYYWSTGSWVDAGTRYNGAKAYGEDLKKKIGEWRERFRG